MPPRTVIHGRIADISDRVLHLEGNVGQGLAAVVQAVQRGTDTSEGMVRSLEHVAAEINTLGAGVRGELTSIHEGMGHVATALASIEHAVVTATGQEPPEPTPEGFQYIRVLNQVEDLVTDHDFECTANNTRLHERWTERAAQDCYQTLRSADPGLARRFEAVYAPFRTDEFRERAERYRLLDRLRRNLVDHFTSPDTAPGAGTRRGRRT